MYKVYSDYFTIRVTCDPLYLLSSSISIPPHTSQQDSRIYIVVVVVVCVVFKQVSVWPWVWN